MAKHSPPAAAAKTEVTTDEVKKCVESEEEKPATKGVLDWFRSFDLVEVDTLLAVFTPPFKVSEIWDALGAAASLGRKAEAFIDSIGGISISSVKAASTVSDAELVEQFKAVIRPPVNAAPDAPRATMTADGSVEMSPVLAGILINLIGALAKRLLERFGR